MALAPSAKDDGLLTSEYFFNLNLNPELVVLSACKTGKGDITGDGSDVGDNGRISSTQILGSIYVNWRSPVIT